MNFRNLIRLELKNFVGGRTVPAVFLCIGLAAIYGIFQGAGIVGKQREIIREIPALQAQHIEKLLEIHEGKDLGDILYYLTFSTINEPSSWAGFSVGQSDVNPFNVKVRMLALEGQIYDSEISNPTNLLFGNFDLSFIIVFLFPLLIIAFMHNLISAEQEGGTWSLLRSQPVSMLKILTLRIGLRFTVIFGAALLMIIFGCLFLHADFDSRFFSAVLLTFAYFAFWFGVSVFVISFGRGSLFNALSLLGAWIFLVILAPALLSSIVATIFPISESLETTIRQREGYHEKWDKPKAETMSEFYEKYPEYKAFPVSEDKFSWGWYYAMQNAGDVDASDSSARYAEALAQRNEFTEKVLQVLPAVNTQMQFNKIAATDLENHLEYLDSVRDFHEEIRTTYYPHIFLNAKISDVDLQNHPKHIFKNGSSEDPFSDEVFAVFFAGLLFIAAAWGNFNLNKSNF